ncbi:glycosyl transferase family 1 [Algoriphagus aquaeductus]|uniref:Glycosyl transferase family 1 n=1 Tax=Algoriphagus aquaeductus TaxID=475299 RepID=A0A326RM83_9BACT|nr:glycosyltransferase [Algoriphagus aquaeductus]PZV76717.1 glycosyl transferase family 1 [Algoriphagus aquaeductus]
MKILFTQDALVNAGAERSHLEILSRFSQDTEVALVYFYPKHELKEEYERAGIRLFFLDIPETYHFPLAVSRLVRLIRKEKPNLLISSLWRADIITRIASLLTGVPLVGTLVNDSYSPIAWTDKKGLKHKVVYWLDRLTAGIPIHWIANAQALANSHVKTLGLKSKKITVVYRGRPVIASAAKQSPKEEADSETASAYLSEKAGLKDSSLAPIPIISGVTDDVIASVGKQSPNEEQFPPTEIASATKSLGEDSSLLESSLAMTKTICNFISYGRLLERKGFQDAIAAFSQVLQSHPDCTLTIFGEGPFRKELEKQIQHLGLQDSVFLPGKITNPMDVLITGYFPKPTSPAFIQASDDCSLTTDHSKLITAHCFLFPSWYEGFSGALVEAMMAGIPIIASDISMNLEAVTNGKTALVFRVGDPQDLAEKISFAIQHPEQMAALGQEARREAEERFDIEKIAKEYEQLVRRAFFNYYQ